MFLFKLSEKGFYLNYSKKLLHFTGLTNKLVYHCEFMIHHLIFFEN